MAPLIYVAFTIPLLLGSAVYAIYNLFIGHDTLTSAVIFTAAMLLIIAGMIVSTSVRSIRNSYGERVGTYSLVIAAFLFNLGTTAYNPWNWIWTVIWAALVAFHTITLKEVQNRLKLTPDQKIDPDTLSRTIPRTGAGGPNRPF